MKVAVLGRTRMLYDAIDKLREYGHQVVLIGTCKAAPEYDIKEKDFCRKAEELQVPFFNDIHINSEEIIEKLKAVDADIAVSMNWITIIKEQAINCFKYGILNAHCGDLPRYRGNATANWAILAKENEYAITIHYMLPRELDSGDIVCQRKFPITEITTITEIYNNMNKQIPDMFCIALDNIVKKIPVIEQDKNPKNVLRCFPRIPSDSIIDWNDKSEDILRLIHASAEPFEGAYTFYKDMKIHIMEAYSSEYEFPSLVVPGQVIGCNKDTHEVRVATGNGVISFYEIIINNEKFSATDILNSTRIRLNYNSQEEIFYLKNKIKELENKIEIMINK